MLHTASPERRVETTKKTHSFLEGISPPPTMSHIRTDAKKSSPLWHIRAKLPLADKKTKNFSFELFFFRFNLPSSGRIFLGFQRRYSKNA